MGRSAATQHTYKSHPIFARNTFGILAPARLAHLHKRWKRKRLPHCLFVNELCRIQLCTRGIEYIFLEKFLFVLSSSMWCPSCGCGASDIRPFRGTLAGLVVSRAMWTWRICSVSPMLVDTTSCSRLWDILAYFRIGSRICSLATRSNALVQHCKLQWFNEFTLGDNCTITYESVKLLISLQTEMVCLVPWARRIRTEWYARHY